MRAANARREMEALDQGYRLESAANRAQLDRMRVADAPDQFAYQKELRDRQRSLWTKEDQAYENYNNALAASGELISEIAGMTPQDFYEQGPELLAQIPGAIMQDPGVAAVLKFKEKQADDYRQVFEKQQAAEAQRQTEFERFRRAQQEDAAFEGVTEEEFTSTLDETGRPDPYRLAALRGKREREREQDKRKQEMEDAYTKHLWGLQRDQLNDEQKRVADVAKNHMVDTDAFPMSVMQLRDQYAQGGKPASDALLEIRAPREFEAAKLRDKNREEAIIEDAREMDEDEFVNFYPSLSDEKKEKRRNVWRVARGQTIAQPQTNTSQEGETQVESAPTQQSAEDPVGDFINQNYLKIR